MGKLSYKRIYQCEECLASLGKVRHRALFGGYSLSIDDTVFAMVAHGELYLRICEQNAAYRAMKPPRLLTLSKRGRPVSLNYYLVDDELWEDSALLIRMSELSLQGAQKEKSRRSDAHRLRNLPNITFQLELLLTEAGIHDLNTLQSLGAATTWYRLRCIRKDLSPSVLLALEGAILGTHAARVPLQRRQHLLDWAEMLTRGRRVRRYEE